MSKFFLTPLLGLFLSTTISAQKESKDDLVGNTELSLRTSFNSYLDYDAGIMLGINYRWTERFSASFEPTWIFYNGFNTEDDQKFFPSGIKIRTDVRYHFTRQRKNSVDFFIAPEFHYKYVQTRKEDQFGINCQNGQCAYMQEAVYTEKKNEIGGLLKLGAIVPLTFIRSSRWFLEFYGGIGAKQLKFRETNLPVGGSFINPPDRRVLSIGQAMDRNTFTRPILPAGLKLVFVL